MVKGITNISTIQKELNNYEQIDIPYIFTPNTKIKYITLDDSTNEEKFYIGGDFIKMANQKIILQNGPAIWSVPIKIRDDNNNIIYESKFFIKKKINHNKNKKEIELEKIIKTQQKVIEKMTITIKEDKIKIQKYENIIKKLKK